MAKFGDFCKIASSYADVADFVTVYIEEAHPVESWVFSNNVVVNAHCKIEDRIEAANQLLAQKPPFPIVCDVMDDTANYAYGALYERLFVIHRGEIAYEGGRGPMFYRLYEIQVWLENYKKLSTENDQNSDSAALERQQMLEELRRCEVYSGKRNFWSKLGEFFFTL